MSLALQSLVFNLTHCTAGDVTSCNVTCTNVASGVAEVDCAQDGGVFAFSGCRANCAALPAYNVATNPGGVVGAAEVTCAQGSSILHGSVCSPVCKQDFMSDVTSLLCNDSAFVPSTFSCGAACAPPDGGPLATTPPCEELDLQQVWRLCHARCEQGSRPRWRFATDPVSCINAVNLAELLHGIVSIGPALHCLLIV